MQLWQFTALLVLRLLFIVGSVSSGYGDGGLLLVHLNILHISVDNSQLA